MFPNTLLKWMMTHHFWTPEQHLRFAEDDLKMRVHFYPQIMNMMERLSRSARDEDLARDFRELLAKVGKT